MSQLKRKNVRQTPNALRGKPAGFSTEASLCDQCLFATLLSQTLRGREAPDGSQRRDRVEPDCWDDRRNGRVAFCGCRDRQPDRYDSSDRRDAQRPAERLEDPDHRLHL